MRKLISRILVFIGAMVVLAVIATFITAILARGSKTQISSNTILELNLETGLLENPPDDPFSRLQTQGQPTLRSIVEGLEKASSDDRVKGLLAHVGAASLSLAEIQEVRDAIQAFRAKKKFAVAFSETLGEFGQGTGSYYLASAFDEIWLQPSGDVGLIGIRMEGQFIKGTLEKLGIAPRFDHRYEYKNAMNAYTEKSFTPAHREAMTKVKDSWFQQLVRGIAQGRKMSEDQVRALINKGPFLGKEAVDAKLVDGVAYRDEVLGKVKTKAGSGSKLLFLKRYYDEAGSLHKSGKRIALIYGIGPVHRGKSSFDALQSLQSMGSTTVAGAFRAAMEDGAVKAILFRVDSPGGSYVASDTIWREVVRARQAGKPVIVSMGAVAGSGGYFVAMPADKIVAQPGTITGSIGVLGGKMLTKGLWDKVGLSFDEVHSGAHANMFDGYSDFTPEEWARFQSWLDRVYADFTSKVAEGRRLPKERVLEIAKGRIWTGEDAKAIGLVDELGGYQVALRLAKQAAKIPEAESIELRVYPRGKTKIEAIEALLAGDERENSEQQAMAQILATFRPLARKLKALGLDDRSGGVLSMPEMSFSH